MKRYELGVKRTEGKITRIALLIVAERVIYYLCIVGLYLATLLFMNDICGNLTYGQYWYYMPIAEIFSFLIFLTLGVTVHNTFINHWEIMKKNEIKLLIKRKSAYVQKMKNIYDPVVITDAE